MIAKRVISDLSRVYQDYVNLEPILWEDLPLEATGSFQGGIDYFLNQSPIDIAIFILWSRLGSKLGSSFHREDGASVLPINFNSVARDYIRNDIYQKMKIRDKMDIKEREDLYDREVYMLKYYGIDLTLPVK